MSQSAQDQGISWDKGGKLQQVGQDAVVALCPDTVGHGWLWVTHLSLFTHFSNKGNHASLNQLSGQVSTNADLLFGARVFSR